MRARRNNVGLDAPVTPTEIDWPVTRKEGDIVSAICAGIVDSASVGAGHAHVLAGAYGDDILRRAGRSYRSFSRLPSVAGGKDNCQLLIARDLALRVPHYAVVFLRNSVVAPEIDSPGIGRDARSLTIGRPFPQCWIE